MTPGVSPPSATSDTVLPSVSADTDGSTAHPCSPAACHPRGQSASRWRRRSDRRQATRGRSLQGPNRSQFAPSQDLGSPRTLARLEGGAWRSWRSLRSKLWPPHTQHPRPLPCTALPFPLPQSRQPIPAPSHQTRPGPRALRLEARGSRGPVDASH